jgi:hypothetical protein
VHLTKRDGRWRIEELLLVLGAPPPAAASAAR